MTGDHSDAAEISRSQIEGLLTRSAALHYQPIVDLNRGVVVGYEALARFQGPPAVAADQWFKAAASYGLGLEVETLVWREAMKSAEDLPANCFLTVNASPEILMSNALERLLATTESFERIVIEVTEHAIVQDYEALNSSLEPLRRKGAIVAVDDAGAGYASLSHILALKPQIVKLDRYFITGCDIDPAKAAVIEMVGKFAGRVDAWLLVEGIERKEELACVQELGVPLAQGYFLARPNPGWTGMSNEVAERVRHKALAMRAGRLMLSVMEEAPRRNGGYDAAAATEVYGFSVRVDGHDRPLSLVEIADETREFEALRVKPYARIADVVQRALIRAPASRYAPVICVDDDGVYMGIARMERMLEALTRDPEQR